MISLTMPSNALMISQGLIDTMQFDVLASDNISATWLNNTELLMESHNDNFALLNYETKSSILNLGSIFYFIFGIAALWAIYGLMQISKLWCDEDHLVRRGTDWVGHKILTPSFHGWFLIESYLEISISAIVGLYVVDYTNESNIASSALTIILTILMCLFPLGNFLVI